MMRLSVALCTYNGEKFIAEQLESIVRQTVLPDELIICDDHSTDKTAQILHEYANKAPYYENAVNTSMPEGSYYMGNEQISGPYLSIIVPVYNVEQYLEKCICSILVQSFKDFELILINDGSTDNSGFLCEQYAKKDRRICIIHQENGGLSAARNAGIDIAAGEYITFVDSDDWIEPDTYELAVAFLQQNQLEVVCFDFYTVRNDKKHYRPMYDSDKIFKGNEALNDILKEKIDNSSVDKLYLRSLFEDLRYPVGRVFEDVALTYKVLAKAKRIGYLHKPLYHYVKRKTSIIGTSFSAQKRWDRFLAHKERLKFAESMSLEAYESCRVLAVRQALSVLTAHYVDGSLSGKQAEQVYGFISQHENQLDFKLIKMKLRWMLIANKYLPFVHKIYSHLSHYTKGLKSF